MTDIAATIQNREHVIETSTFSDILGTISHLPVFTWNTFGSAYEGSTVYGMNSDVDSVLLHQEFQVVEECSAAPPGKSLLVIQDEPTPAGYAKLQLLCDGEPLLAKDLYKVELATNAYKITLDKQKRIIVSFNLPGVSGSLRSRQERHGPALSAGPGRSQLAKDIVLGLYCKDFPKSAAEWLVRRRRYNWPPRSILEACKSMGFILVSIGHPLSDEEEIQWRISLSYQERMLITQFHTEQLMCFILLKLTKKDVLRKRMQVESLTSYHLKTCMLFMVENTPRELWKPENLLKCLVMCLEKLERWVEDGICPNYFITAENMFERKIHGEVQRKLKQVLHDLLSEDCKFINEIQTAAVGERLNIAYCPSPLSQPASFGDDFGRNVAQINQLGSLGEMALYIMNCVRTVLQFDFDTHRSAVERLLNKVGELKTTTTVTVHTEEETQRVLSLLLPYLQISLMANIVVLAYKQHESPERIWSLLSSSEWRSVSSRVDRFTGKLKHATLLYMCGYYSASLDLLLSIKDSGISFAVCECDEKEDAQFDLREFFYTTRRRPRITIEDFMKNFSRPCIMFLPTEIDLVPLPLQYEMRRSECNTGALRYEPFHFWYDWAVVDPKILLYLLLYLNSRKLNENQNAELYLASMRDVQREIGIPIRTHSETALNIAGWMNKDSGKVETARNLFEASLRLRPHHNAAVLHLQDLNQ